MQAEIFVYCATEAARAKATEEPQIICKWRMAKNSLRTDERDEEFLRASVYLLQRKRFGRVTERHQSLNLPTPWLKEAREKVSRSPIYLKFNKDSWTTPKLQSAYSLDRIADNFQRNVRKDL